MFKKDHVQKNILCLILTDSYMFFMYILLRRCFDRISGRTKGAERYLRREDWLTISCDYQGERISRENMKN